MNGSLPKVPRSDHRQLHPERGRLLAFLHEPSGDFQVGHLFRHDASFEIIESLSRVLFTPIFGHYGWDNPSG